MNADLAARRRCSPGGRGAFTLAGVLTGLTATAAVAVLCAFVASRVVQRGMRQARDAVAGMESSVAGGIEGLSLPDTGLAEQDFGADGVAPPPAAWIPSSPPQVVSWPWPHCGWAACWRARAWRRWDFPTRQWLRPLRPFSLRPPGRLWQPIRWH